jgi:hypothetical protein
MMGNQFETMFDPDITQRTVSVAVAAEITKRTQDNIRKLIRAGRLTDYGKDGEYRVSIGELLKRYNDPGIIQQYYKRHQDELKELARLEEGYWEQDNATANQASKTRTNPARALIQEYKESLKFDVRLIEGDVAYIQAAVDNITRIGTRLAQELETEKQHLEEIRQAYAAAEIDARALNDERDRLIQYLKGKHQELSLP